MAIGKSGYGLSSVQEAGTAAAASGGRRLDSDSKQCATDGGKGWQGGAGAVQAAPFRQGVRTEKVAEIRAALAAGTYRVSAWEVAAKMCALGGAAVTGRDAGGNQGGKVESWKGRRDGIPEQENCDSRKEFVAGAVEETRASRDGEWKRMPEVSRVMVSSGGRVNRISCTKLQALMHARGICATMRERCGTSLFRSRRSKRFFHEVQ